MTTHRADPTLTPNCRAQHGMPHRPTQARCTGCSCGCHAVAPPPNFRDLVRARKARGTGEDTETSSPDGVGTLPGLDGTGDE